MPANRERMILCAFLHNCGAHPGGWRHAGAEPERLQDLSFYQEIAATAERGKFHVLFLGDAQGMFHIAGREAYAGSDGGSRPDPTLILGALCASTRQIGLVSTVSTTFNEPYAVARRIGTLDHLSRGRAGWNVVTSTNESEARNFGGDQLMEHDLRYARAEEFVDVVKALWDCWEDDAFTYDKKNGRFFDPDKLHALGHAGKFFKVAGPLNLARPPQGHPVIIQAGASGPGRALAARTADLIFTAQPNMAAAKKFADEIRGTIAAFGRDPAKVGIIPSIQLLVRSTEAEAKAAEAELLSLIPPQRAISQLQMLLGGFDLSPFDPDGPLPDLPLSNATQSNQQKLIEMARTESLSIRQLAQRATVSRASWSMAGTPEQIADALAAWFHCGAADGFSLAPNYLPDGLTEFVDQVVPILQKRGLFRTDYEGVTLRDNLGLPRPINTFVADPTRHVEPAIWARASRSAT